MGKNPLLAGILSLIIPGTGYFYAGKNLRGVLALGLFVLFLGSLYKFYSNPLDHPLGLSYAVFFILYLTFASDAYRITKRENKANDIFENQEESTDQYETCPQCGTDIKGEICPQCGKNTEETLFFSKGDISDVEITKLYLIVYKRNMMGKRTGETDKYIINRMKDIKLKDSPRSMLSPVFGHIRIEFNYNKNKNHPQVKKSVYMKEDDVYDLMNTLELRKIPYEGKDLFKIK